MDEISIQEFIEKAKKIGLTDREIQERIDVSDKLNAKYPHLIRPVSWMLQLTVYRGAVALAGGDGKTLKEKFREILEQRIALHVNDGYGAAKLNEIEAAALTENIEETIEFLDNECTADEFSWISEVFEGIAEKSQSQAFIDCLYRVAAKYPEECQKYCIYPVIEYANDCIDEV